MPSADGSSEHALRDYLDQLGLAEFAPLPGPPRCELCGGDTAPAIRTSVRVVGTFTAPLLTRCCAYCGLIFQSPRFVPDFYRAYYARVYRRLLHVENADFAAYVADQVARGDALMASLASDLPQGGRLFDVGCGAGGLMYAFRRRGWKVAGVEPDIAAAAYARERLGLPVEAADAEAMKVDDGSIDLTLITGSLEHVHDLPVVLARCHRAAAPGSLLLVEAHGLGQAAHSGAIGHNHRRLLTANSLTLLMLRFGWLPRMVTADPLAGPTRPGSVFALGEKCAHPVPGTFEGMIARGHADTPVTMSAELDRLGIA